MADRPRIASLALAGATKLTVAWCGGGSSTIDLAGWLGRPNPVMEPLSDPTVFKRAAVGAHGSMVTWDGGEGDLAIDAAHLQMIADEQAPFGAAEAAAWQQAMGVSNTEAADLLGVVPSTWSGYKRGAKVPATVARLCRAARRDPLILHAHLRPRVQGRPKGALGSSSA